MRLPVDINAFTSGELSPRMLGRTDVAKTAAGARSVLNMVVMPQGGLTRRPGTQYVAQVGNQSYRARLVEFVFSVVQAYIIELGELTARFYMNDGQITSGGAPVQIATPWHASELAAIQTAQSADTLYCCHPSYQTRTITRSSHTSWSVQALTVKDGPYLPVNTTATVLTFGGTSGSVSVTASGTGGINNGQGFLASDVGRLIRVKFVSIWGWLTITAVADTTHCTATVGSTVTNGAFGPLDGAAWTPNTVYPVGAIVSNGGSYFYVRVSGRSAGSGGPSGTGINITDGTITWGDTSAPPNASNNWMLGKWSGSTGWPYAPMFWQNRLVLAGTNNEPAAIELSVVGDFTNFAPTQADGTVTAANALSWILSDDQVNAVRWLSPAGSAQAMQLGIGTTGRETVLQPATNTQGLSATNVQAYFETTYGSAPNVRPTRIGKSVLFFNRSARKLHEWTFQWSVNGYVGPDLAVLAEHITRTGITAVAWQSQPHGVLWCIRGDGALIGLTYLREQDIVAWHRHQLGGQYYGGAPIIESVACIPSPDGTYDEVWLSVLRTVAGTPTRTIEVMTPYFDGQPVDQAFFVDCGLSSGLTYPAATLTITGLTNTALKGEAAALTGTGVATASVGVFSAGSIGAILRANGDTAVVTGYTDNTHVTINVVAAMSGMAPCAPNAWSLTALRSSYTGMGHLVGETVSVLADGMPQGTQVVGAGGSVVAAPAASLLTCGLPYDSVGVTMPFNPARAAAAGRIKIIDTMFLRLHESVGGFYGTRTQDEFTAFRSDDISPIVARYGQDQAGAPASLFSGPRRLQPLSDFDQEAEVIFGQTDPLPFTVLALGLLGDVTEQTQ